MTKLLSKGSGPSDALTALEHSLICHLHSLRNPGYPSARNMEETRAPALAPWDPAASDAAHWPLVRPSRMGPSNPAVVRRGGGRWRWPLEVRPQDKTANERRCDALMDFLAFAVGVVSSMTGQAHHVSRARHRLTGHVRARRPEPAEPVERNGSDQTQMGMTGVAGIRKLPCKPQATHELRDGASTGTCALANWADGAKSAAIGP